jgi:hypothetical protein
MAVDSSIALTQRAYTLRLRPAITRSDWLETIREKTRELQDALMKREKSRGAKKRRIVIRHQGSGVV